MNFDFLPTNIRLGDLSESEKLNLINRQQPSDHQFPDLSSLITVRGIAADNLINRSNMRWGPDEIQKMADLIVGKPFLLNHDSSRVETSWARIFRAKAIRSDSAPDELIDIIGKGEENRKILRKEGYWTVYVDAYADKTSPVVRWYQYASARELSTGGFVYSDFWCPTCDTSAYNPKCPHSLAYPGIRTESGENLAPYFTRKGLSDILELSLVATPNLPGARLI